MNRVHTKGFSVIEVGLVIAVVAIIGGLGFVFYNKWSANQSTTAMTTTPTTSASPSTATAPTISSTSDLSAASTALDTTDVTSSSDTSALNGNLSF